MYDPRYPTEPAGFETGGESLSAEARRTLEGLLFILDHEPDLNLRLKAVRALGSFHEMSALRALAETALYDEDPPVRLAAQQQIESLFGEESDSYLESIRIEIEGEDDEDEEDDFWLEVQPQQSALRAPSIYNNSPSVVQEERPPIWLWVVLGTAVLGGVWFFFIR